VTVFEACRAARNELEERLDATSAADLFGDAEQSFAMPAVQLLEPSGSFAANPCSGVGGAEEVLLSARGGVPSSEMDGVALDGTPRHADADGGSLLGGALTGSLVPTKVWPTRAARFSSARSYANCASDRPGSCAVCKASCTSRFSNCSSPPSMTSTKCTPPSPRRHSASGCSPPGAADDGVVDGSDGPNGSDALLRATCATEGTSAAGSRYSRASHCTVA